MGVHILLFVNGDRIGSDIWERVYAESLVLLRAFPAPLMRLAVENIDEERRYTFTSEIVRDRGTREERWIVDGDMKSRTPAEPFELYRFHDRQFPTDDFFATAGPNSEDVLWAKPTDEPHDIHANGCMVWNSKTQGRPYHYAMLAVGMLVESRCPGCAYVTGDIDLSQAEEVRQWVNPLLEEPLALPICVDPDRLYNRLSEIYEKEEHVVSRATGLFLGSDTELHRALTRHAGRATADAWFKQRLADFDSLSHVGASELLTSFLEATGDVARLVEVMQEIASAPARVTDEGAGFSLDGLLHELCSRFITIPPEERDVLETYGLVAAAATAGALKTSDEVIYDAFLKIARTPSPVPVYVAADELLELFARADPEQRGQFAETIRTEERNCREALKDFADARRAVSTSSQEHGASGTANNRTSGGTSDGTDPIREEVARQTVHHEAEEDSARELGEMIRGKLMSAPVVTTPETRSELLAELYRVTRIHGIVLTETAWNRIDALRDETLLRHLLALAAIKYDEIHFCEGRLHVLESARLWPVLAGVA
ncbi:MAG: hypothetical protein ACLFS5_10570 [Spirochaetaceae bacterium]